MFESIVRLIYNDSTEGFVELVEQLNPDCNLAVKKSEGCNYQSIHHRSNVLGMGELYATVAKEKFTEK